MLSVQSVAARIRKEGQPVTFTRGDTSATVQAFVAGYMPAELVGGILQGDRQLRVAPGDLADNGWSDAPRKPDRVQIGANSATVQSAETVYLRGSPAVYVIQVRGG